MTRMGQNTGMLKQSKNVQIKPITVLLVTEYQNLNSGNLLMKGLNSSLARVGNSGPLSSPVIKKLHCFIQFWDTMSLAFEVF